MKPPSRQHPIPTHPRLTIGACVLTSVCFVAALSRTVIHLDEHPAGEPGNLTALWLYWTAYAASWTALTCLLWRLSRSRNQPMGPVGSSRPTAPLIILLVAVVLRLITVLTTSPQLSGDLWRYTHDGATLAHGQNPYALAPDRFTALTSPHPPVLDRINHPHLVTIYQPLSQITFAALWWLHPPALDPLADITFRLGFVMIDGLVIVLLLLQLARERRSAWWAALYAWHPLAISEVAGSGHQDVLGIACLLAALWLIDRSRARRIHAAASGGAGGAGVALVMAGAVKPIVIPLAWPMVQRIKATPRAAGSAALAATVTGLLLYAPFAWMDPGIGHLLETTQTFVRTWAFNSSVHGALTYCIESKTTADLLMAGLLLTVLVASTRRRPNDVWANTKVYLFTAVLVSSTAHPWYLLWALVLLPVRFDAATWVWSLTIAWSYAVLRAPPAWDLPAWVVVAEYLPVYAVLGFYSLRWFHNRRRPDTPHGPVGVI